VLYACLPRHRGPARGEEEVNVSKALVLRVMLHTHWSAEAWSQVRSSSGGRSRCGARSGARGGSTDTSRDHAPRKGARRQSRHNLSYLGCRRPSLPMQLQIGDRMTDSTGEWEVVGRPAHRTPRRRTPSPLSGQRYSATWPSAESRRSTRTSPDWLRSRALAGPGFPILDWTNSPCNTGDGEEQRRARPRRGPKGK
jgi:hypothetical protein